MMESSSIPHYRPATPGAGRGAVIALPDAVYRDFLTTLFSMSMPILGFGILFCAVGALIFLKWPDPMIGAVIGGAAVITGARLFLIRAYHRAGGSSQDVATLRLWERRYAGLTYVLAMLLAALNVRALMAHQPLLHVGTISLVFTFGAGIVSRNAARPRLCVISLVLAVVPTSLALLLHSVSAYDERLHGQFFALEAVLLLAVLAMSLDSVRHLYAFSVEHFITKHDLAKLARYDPLTGLPNRLLLREAFQTSVRSLTASKHLALHYLDLDGFKAINDHHGHPAGDKMLVEVAHRLTSMLRAEDVACRLGGDEFILLQSPVQHADQAQLLARRVIRQLSEPYWIDGTEMRISVSIGIAVAPEYGIELERLISCADAALYRSKARGKAQVHFCGTDDYQEAGRAVA